MRTYVLLLAATTLLFACDKKDDKSSKSNKSPAAKKSDTKTPATNGTTKTTKPAATASKAVTPSTPSATASKATGPASPDMTLQDPSRAKLTAPAEFTVKFDTTKGPFVMKVVRAWSPNGADRFYTMVKIGYFKDIALFRAVKGFMVQFGIHGDPSIGMKWLRSNIQDDPVVKSNTRGFVTFAKARMPNSRSVQVFINYADRNAQLDRQGFSPFGKVIKGMDVVDSFYTGYGERTTRLQGVIAKKGNQFLKDKFPKLDYIKSATILSEKKQ